MIVIPQSLKVGLSIGGVALGSGGVAGLAHATPTILWKTGVTCRNVGGSGVRGEVKEPGWWLKLRGGKEHVKLDPSWLNDGATCYK